MPRDLARGKPPSEQPSTKGLQDLSCPAAPQQGPNRLLGVGHLQSSNKWENT